MNSNRNWLDAVKSGGNRLFGWVFAPNVLVTLAVFLLLFMLIYPMLTTTNLFAIDPWRHFFFTRFGEAQQFFTNEVPLLGNPARDSYPTILRSNMHLYNVLSGVDAYTTTRFFTLFLRVAYLMLVYAVVQVFTGQRRWAILGTVVTASSYYFIWRSNNTWPENQVVLMYLLALWGFERHRQTRQRRDLVVTGLALVGAIYTHSPSVYVFLFMLAGYGLLALLDKDWATLKGYTVVVLAAILLATPSIVQLGGAFIRTLTSNLGENSVWAPIAREQSRYNPIDALSYQRMVGETMLILGVLGIITMLLVRFRERIPLLIVMLCGFVLSLSTHYSLYIPPNRTMGFLYIPVIPVAMIGAQAVFDRLPARPLRALFVGLVAVAAFMTMYSTTPYDANTGGEPAMAARVNATLADNPGSLGFMGGSSVMSLMDYPDLMCERVEQRIDGHYDSRRALEGDTRCFDPTYLVVNREDTRAVPGYTLLFEEGDYALWQKRR